MISVSAVSSLCAALPLLTLTLHQLCFSDQLQVTAHCIAEILLYFPDIRLSSMFMFMNKVSYCSEAYDILQI